MSDDGQADCPYCDRAEFHVWAKCGVATRATWTQEDIDAARERARERLSHFDGTPPSTAREDADG